MATGRNRHVLGLEVSQHPRPGLPEVTLEDGLPDAVHVNVEVQILDGAHVEFDGDEALGSRKHFLHVHRHLYLVRRWVTEDDQRVCGGRRGELGGKNVCGGRGEEGEGGGGWRRGVLKCCLP